MDNPKPSPVSTRSNWKSRIIGALAGVAVSTITGVGLYLKNAIPDALHAYTETLTAYVNKTEKAPTSSGTYFQSYFIIQSATMLLSVEEDTANSEQIIVKERIVYTLLFLKDFDNNHGRFSEQFELLNAYKSSHWPGSENEVLGDANGRSFDVQFTAKKGETRTFATGVDFTVDPSSLADQRPEMHGKLNVARRQRLTDYDNKYGDIIGELNIIVSSQSLILSPIGSGGKILRVDRGQELEDIPVHAAGLEDRTSGYSIISARFENILPGDDAGIIYEWRKKSGT